MRVQKGIASSALVVALLSTASIALLSALPAQAQQSSTARTFNIPAQPLASALTQFGRQSGLQVSVNSAATQGRSSSAVSGTLPRDQALSRLLSGTGVNFRFSGSSTVIISADTGAGNDTTATVEGAIALDTIDVAGAGRSDGGFTPDTPYQTPGSVSHISREQIDRVAPTSPGDIFINTPGVISAGNRVGTSIQPNIRGLQGMGRVKVTVDGAEQTVSSYKGYNGNRDETYIDPDMIGGVDITKGPSDGTIGGSVAFRTLSTEDIIKEGQTWGVRLRGSLGSNTSDLPGIGTTVGSDRPGSFNGDSRSGSVATAATTEHFDFVAAYSKRVQGNYFVGTKVPDGIVFPGQTGTANAIVPAGGEAMNTSEDTESVLLKGKAKWGDGQSLELSYNLYDSTHGEIIELFFSPWDGNSQLAPTTTRVDSYTAKYRWNPSDNDLLNFRAKVWHSNVDVDRGSDGWRTVGIMGDNRLKMWGGDIGNAAIFSTAVGTYTLDTGAMFTREEAETLQTWDERRRRWNDMNGPTGTRDTFAGFANLRGDLTDWLTVSGGLRYDHFSSKGTDGESAEFPERSDSRFSPSAGVTLKPADGIQLFATYAEGYRAPTLRETHWRVRPLGNNPDLRGEVGKNWEYGVNVLRKDVFTSGDSLRFKAAYFDNHYDDYIIRSGTPSSGQTCSGQYCWTNIDGANFTGFELSGTYDAGLWFLEGSFTKYRSVEYCVEGSPCFTPGGSGRSPLTNDYVASYIPPEYSGSLTAGIRLFEEKLTLGGRMHFSSARIGSKWSDTQGSGQVGVQFTWPDYMVFDAFGSYKFDDTTALNFSVENITDEYYFGALASAGIPSPGRTARAGLTLRF